MNRKQLQKKKLQAWYLHKNAGMSMTEIAQLPMFNTAVSTISRWMKEMQRQKEGVYNL